MQWILEINSLDVCNNRVRLFVENDIYIHGQVELEKICEMKIGKHMLMK